MNNRCHPYVIEPLLRDTVHNQRASDCWLLLFLQYHKWPRKHWAPLIVSIIYQFSSRYKSFGLPFRMHYYLLEHLQLREIPEDIYPGSEHNRLHLQICPFWILLCFSGTQKMHPQWFYNRLPMLKPFIRKKGIQFPFFPVDCLNLLHQQKRLGFLLMRYDNQFQNFIKSVTAMNPATGNT